MSAKTGEGVQDILEAVIARIPPPKGARRAAQGVDHRLMVRQLRRRGDAGARRGRGTAAAGPHAVHVYRHDLYLRAGGNIHAEVAA